MGGLVTRHCGTPEATFEELQKKGHQSRCFSWFRLKRQPIKSQVFLDALKFRAPESHIFPGNCWSRIPNFDFETIVRDNLGPQLCGDLIIY